MNTTNQGDKTNMPQVPTPDQYRDIAKRVNIIINPLVELRDATESGDIEAAARFSILACTLAHRRILAAMLDDAIRHHIMNPEAIPGFRWQLSELKEKIASLNL